MMFLPPCHNAKLVHQFKDSYFKVFAFIPNFQVYDFYDFAQFILHFFAIRDCEIYKLSHFIVFVHLKILLGFYSLNESKQHYFIEVLLVFTTESFQTGGSCIFQSSLCPEAFQISFINFLVQVSCLKLQFVSFSEISWKNEKIFCV